MASRSSNQVPNRSTSGVVEMIRDQNDKNNEIFYFCLNSIRVLKFKISMEQWMKQLLHLVDRDSDDSFDNISNTLFIYSSLGLTFHVAMKAVDTSNTRDNLSKQIIQYQNSPILLGVKTEIITRQK